MSEHQRSDPSTNDGRLNQVNCQSAWLYLESAWRGLWIESRVVKTHHDSSPWRPCDPRASRKLVCSCAGCAAQADVRGRRRSRDNAQHESALFELYWHELLRSSGYEVEIHPTLAGLTTNPDFLVRSCWSACTRRKQRLSTVSKSWHGRLTTWTIDLNGGPLRTRSTRCRV
jgi:hypothetical protein